MNLPRFALSVRQPWAWAIIHAGKTIENRQWHTRKAERRFRGPVCIHASQGLGKKEYESAVEFIEERCSLRVPPPAELVRGAIIGTCDVIGGITRSHNPWWMGPFGLLLDNQQALEQPIRCIGQLGFFDWKASEEPYPEPFKWMLPKMEPQGALL
jgi:hypothetical protein